MDHMRDIAEELTLFILFLSIGWTTILRSPHRSESLNS